MGGRGRAAARPVFGHEEGGRPSVGDWAAGACAWPWPAFSRKLKGFVEMLCCRQTAAPKTERSYKSIKSTTMLLKGALLLESYCAG